MLAVPVGSTIRAGEGETYIYWLVLSQIQQGSKLLGKLNDLYIALCIYKKIPEYFSQSLTNVKHVRNDTYIS